MNNNITAMVFTFNEERRLPFVYENLKDFCQIIVFDGGSSDGTEDYCKAKNIKFLLRKEDDNDRINGLIWSYDNSPTDYTLHVYCHYFYPKELLDTFSEIANKGELSAVYHDMVVYRYGKVVQKTIVRRISSACSFYKKSIIDFKNTKIHNELAIQFDEDSMVRLDARDELSLHRFIDEDCQSFTVKTIDYAAREASQKFIAGYTIGFFGLLFKPLWRFSYSYFLRTGTVVRGTPGLIYALMNLIYDYHVCIIIWELCHDLDLKGVIRENELTRLKLIRGMHDSEKK